MDFGYALNALKEGKKVFRAGWNGKNMWIVLMPALCLPPFSSQSPGAKVNDRTAKHIGEDTPLDSQPYLAMWTAKGQWQPGWLASQADMLADDWWIMEDIKQAPPESEAYRHKMELPKYDCHKTVHAAKITGIGPQNNVGMFTLFFGEIGGSKDLPGEWQERFKPEVGGYFVVYKDGYTSFSPAKAFEEGYTKN